MCTTLYTQLYTLKAVQQIEAKMQGNERNIIKLNEVETKI